MTTIVDTTLIKHLSHIDELLYSNDQHRQTLINFCSDVVKMIEHQSIECTNIKEMTTKIDGSVSIVFGLHPQQRKFFIGSKSVFNKKPKINFTLDDIYSNHNKSIGLVKTLVYLYNILSKIEFKGVYQGDLLFTEYNISYSDDGLYASFTPNTITYSIDSSLVKGKKIGLSVHTIYTVSGIPKDDLSLDHMTSKQLLSPCHELMNNKDIYLVKTATPINKLLKNSNMKDKIRLSALKQGLKVLNSLSKQLVNYDDVILTLNTELVKYSNNCIRTETKHTSGGLLAFIQRSKILKDDKKVLYIDLINANKNAIDIVFAMQEELTSWKDILLIFMNEHEHDLTCTHKGEKTQHEGFVFKFNNLLLKLVNRSQFSRLNFNNDRF